VQGVNVTAQHGNVGLQEALRAVSSAALLPGFHNCFLVNGLGGLALHQLGLMMVVRSNFTDCLKWALTLFS
jgi:hypothetical protein